MPNEFTPAVLTIEGPTERPVFKLNGMVLPVVEMRDLIIPHVPKQDLFALGHRKPVMQIVGSPQPGMVTLTLMLSQIQLHTEDGKPPEPQTYRREGLDL